MLYYNRLEHCQSTEFIIYWFSSFTGRDLIFFLTVLWNWNFTIRVSKSISIFFVFFFFFFFFFSIFGLVKTVLSSIILHQFSDEAFFNAVFFYFFRLCVCLPTFEMWAKRDGERNQKKKNRCWTYIIFVFERNELVTTKTDHDELLKLE